MPFSIYDITIPQFIHHLRTLSTLLTKASDQISTDTLLASRLIADMHPLPYQIQRISDTAKLLCVRLAAVPNESFPDTETTLPELQERISKTVAFLERVRREDLDAEGVEAKVVELFGRTMGARDYVLSFAIPNFYFHYVTAYALLRKEGATIGKNDYMGVA